MPKNSAGDVRNYRYTQNRELSWLAFNSRVLEQAAEESVPLLERLRFLSLFMRNLDEFFMVRVGRLLNRRAVAPQERDHKSGMTPREQLDRVLESVSVLLRRKDELYAEVMSGLAQAGVRNLSGGGTTEAEKAYLEEYFYTQALPLLSPQIVDRRHPMPILEQKQLCLAVSLEQGEKSLLGLVPIPAKLPPCLLMPGSSRRFLPMESLLLQWVPFLFKGYLVRDACVFCVTRSADLAWEADCGGEGMFRYMGRMLRERSRLPIVRLETWGAPGRDLKKLLRGRAKVSGRWCHESLAPLQMDWLQSLEFTARELIFPEYEPRWPEDLEEGSVIQQVLEKDRLLFFPYDQVTPFLRLLEEASVREDVAAIKIAVYRLAPTSQTAELLCRAAENGKDVTVLMELRARFDEANNISWAKRLEEAGCRVVYGLEGVKCHSKICQIVLQREGRPRYITQIGTGNYNEITNAQYTDLSLLTASDEIGADGAAFFRNMLTGNLKGNYRHLLVSPGGIRAKLLELMDREARRGPEGYVCLKANALTDRELIQKLAEVSRAGARVELVLRGICCIRPGIPGDTETIRVTSTVGRYLEHARIYCFGRGERAELYLSSADLMARNLERRVEVACPVYEESVREQLLWMLSVQTSKWVKADVLLPDGTYRREGEEGRPDCQEVFMKVSSHKKHAAEERRGMERSQALAAAPGLGAPPDPRGVFLYRESSEEKGREGNTV